MLCAFSKRGDFIMMILGCMVFGALMYVFDRVCRSVEEEMK